MNTEFTLKNNPDTLEHPLTQVKVEADPYEHIDLLVKTSQQGSIVAKDELVRRFTPLIRSLAWRYEKNLSDFEDACQDGFLQFIKLLEQYDFTSMPPFNAHVKKMLTFFFMRRREHLWKGIERLQTQSLENYDQESSEYYDHMADDTADFDQIYSRYWKEFLLNKLPELIASLPEKNRTAIELVYLKKMTHRQAGLVEGIQEITMTMRVRRGLKLLRKQIEKLAEDNFFIF